LRQIKKNNLINNNITNFFQQLSLFLSRLLSLSEINDIFAILVKYIEKSKLIEKITQMAFFLFFFTHQSNQFEFINKLEKKTFHHPPNHLQHHQQQNNS
jgi:hypothetical protein